MKLPNLSKIDLSRNITKKDLESLISASGSRLKKYAPSFLPPVLLMLQLTLLIRVMIAPHAGLYSLRENVLIFFSIISMLVILPLDYRITSILSSAVILGIYVLNSHVVASRGRPIGFIDIYCMRDAWAVSDRYPFTLTDEMIKYIILTLILTGLFCILYTEIKKRIDEHRLPVSLVTLAATILIIPGLITVYTSRQYKPNFNENAYVNSHGLFSTVLSQCIHSRPVAPEGYSTKTATDLIEKYEAMDIERNIVTVPTNIIMIMNESLTDYSLIGEPELSSDPLPGIHELKDNCVKGRLSVNVQGARTCNTEFEVLTGCSMSFLPDGSIPFVQYNLLDVDSLPGSLTPLGFESTPIHGYYGSEYKRSTIYSKWFSEKFVSAEFFSKGFATNAHTDNIFNIDGDFSNDHVFGDDLEYVNRFISDAQTYKMVEEILREKKDGEKSFIFDLTMQNHGDYSVHTGDYEVIPYTGNEYFDNYLSLSHISDKAFTELLDDLRSLPEPTVVIIFGDHQPYIGFDAFKSRFSDGDETGLMKTSDKFIVPYVMWANYETVWEVPEHFSANYMPALIKKNCGIELSASDKLSLTVMNEYPVITARYCVNKAGEYVPFETALRSPAVKDYMICQYYRMFGRK